KGSIISIEDLPTTEIIEPFFSTHAEEQGSTGDNYKNLGWSVYSWKDDDDGLVYAQLYDAYGNDVLLFRVNTKEQLEAYGGIDGSSGSWDVVSKTYKTS
ncbi:MAG: hypothetical protein ACTHWL_08280, partial [Streptococcus thermophilus]